MAFTSADLDAVKAVIASGELAVQHGDRSVTYRSLADLERAVDRIEKELGASAPDRLTARHQVASFSDG